MGEERKLFLWQISLIVPLTNKYLTELACPEENSDHYYLVTVANPKPVQKIVYLTIYLIISSPQSLVTCLTGRNELCVSCVRDYHF